MVNWKFRGVLNEIEGAFLLGDENRIQRKVITRGDKLIIDVPAEAPDQICSVVRLDIKGDPVVMNPPLIEAEAELLFDKMEVILRSNIPEVMIRYTLDGTIPTEQSSLYSEGAPVILTGNTTVKAALFSKGNVSVKSGRELSANRFHNLLNRLKI